MTFISLSFRRTQCQQWKIKQLHKILIVDFFDLTTGFMSLYQMKRNTVLVTVSNTRPLINWISLSLFDTHKPTGKICGTYSTRVFSWVGTILYFPHALTSFFFLYSYSSFSCIDSFFPEKIWKTKNKNPIMKNNSTIKKNRKLKRKVQNIKKVIENALHPARVFSSSII